MGSNDWTPPPCQALWPIAWLLSWRLMKISHIGSPAHCGSGARRARVYGLLLATLACSLATEAQNLPTKNQQRLAAVIDRTVRQGKEAVLPPHISVLLGISLEEVEVPVKQFVQMKELVRGIDVCDLQRDDVVMFVEDRAKKESTFYLTSPNGGLRKVLSVRQGTGYNRAPTPADRKAFDTEKRFWLDSLAPDRPQTKP